MSTFDPRELTAGITIAGQTYRYCSLAALERVTEHAVSRLPACLKILAENLVRQSASGVDRSEDLRALLSFLETGRGGGEIRFQPTRVMMDDTAGVPLLGDLAAMRDAVKRAGGDPLSIDLGVPVDFIVDHSVSADETATPDALAGNAALEFRRNGERFAFVRWAEQAFRNLRVVPPGGGICHQINLEHLSQVVRRDARKDGIWLLPDTMVGIDSHTPMVNGLGIVGWGVSGIEGVSAALGEPVSIRLPDVIGVRLDGRFRAGVTATDLALTLTQTIRREDCTGAFVEYFGSGLDSLSVPDRATVANMSPECGTTMGFFPSDDETLSYLSRTGRTAAHVEVVAAYLRAQGLWRGAATPAVRYSRTLQVDLDSIEPSLAGPGEPHRRVSLAEAPRAFAARCPAPARARLSSDTVAHGDVVIAAITSCTNTSNPVGMITAGMLACNAVARGLVRKPWVKTSLSPGSRVVAEYLKISGLQAGLDALGFNVTGFGCMTCVGNSGPLAEPVAREVRERNVNTVAVISGNRNYDGRIHPLVSATFLASPPLVVTYALAGTIGIDLACDPIGSDEAGRPVHLRDIWPSAAEVERVVDAVVQAPLFSRAYGTIHEGTERWRGLAHATGPQFAWDPASTVIRRPPDFGDAASAPGASVGLLGARVLAIFGDTVTTEHVSPMGPIPVDSLAAGYLHSLGVSSRDLGTYANRRLVPGVMARGTFSSPHLRNTMIPDAQGGQTLHQPSGARLTIFDAALRYRREGVPLVVIAGRQYGAGSSRDWAAKGPRWLGVKAVIADSFERLHRGNLVAAGVLPLRSAEDGPVLRFTGAEELDIPDFANIDEPRARVVCHVRAPDGNVRTLRLTACLETREEVDCFRDGGTYRHFLRRSIAPAPQG